MKNNRILIFSAGLNQYLLIKAARDLGITSVALESNSNAQENRWQHVFTLLH